MFSKTLILLVTFSLSLVATADDEDTNKSKENSAKKELSQAEAAIKLESVFVGDKEQPAISYFIPWQGVGAPDKLNWNVEEKHDKVLDLVDRDIMLRSIHFYEEMQLEALDTQ